MLIHPFDHFDIVAGQGTCGLEILEQCPDVRTVIVSAGGGGFLAGIATAVKGLRPDVRVVGVQAEGAAAYPASLAQGVPVPLGKMSTMADGIAVGCPGEVPFAAIQQYVDQFLTVSEESLSRALLMTARAGQARRRARGGGGGRGDARRPDRLRDARPSWCSPAATSTRCC